MRSTSIMAAVAVAVLALAACGDDDNGDVSTTDGPTDGPTDDNGGGGDLSYPTGADDLVLQVTNVNVTTAPGSEIGTVPFFSLYGDGRVITVGPTTQEFPGAALPNLVQGTISTEDVEAILSDADAAGLLDGEPDLGDVGLAGGSTTIITINAGGEERRIDAYAVDAGDSEDELTDEQEAARERVSEFVSSLNGDTADAEYQADAVGVFVQSPFDSGDEAEEIDWPLGDLADAGEPIESTSDIRCVVFTGDDAQTVLDAAAAARENAVWLSEGEPYSLTFRPLLPNEETCADLEGAGAR